MNAKPVLFMTVRFVPTIGAKFNEKFAVFSRSVSPSTVKGTFCMLVKLAFRLLLMKLATIVRALETFVIV